MNRREKTKWFFIGLGAGWIPIIVFAIIVLIKVNSGDQHDPFGGVRPDMGESLSKFWCPSVWKATHMPLGDSGFKAAAGAVRHQDEDDKKWDYYSIDVEKPEGNSFYVFFRRDFRLNEIPAELINKKVQEIVTFDKESQMVTFTIGTKRHIYKLPKR